MFGFKNKDKTKEKQKGDQKVSQTAVSHSQYCSNNATTTRRVTYSFSSSYSSNTVLQGKQYTDQSQHISTSSTPNLPLAQQPRNTISLFEVDARPFNPITITPNYKSPYFSRTGSARLPSTSTAQPTSNYSTARLVPAYQRPITRQVPTSNSNNFTNTVAVPSIQNQTNINTKSVVPTYDTNGKKRGNVIVINNINFLKNEENRKGAEFDETDVSKLFKDMGFDVKVCRNLKASEMRSKIKKFSTDGALAKGDISIVVMMSHGSNTNNNQPVSGSFTQISGTDGNSLPIEEILAQFTSDKCPGMKGKPKIFIFQCCRGEQSESLHVDAVPIRNVIKQHADMLIAFSTLPGFYSIRDPQKGSWYIQSICEVFKRHAKTEDVESLLKIVDDQLTKNHPQYVQTSNYESRGFKKCFLNPK